jgi:hypothetical protein
VNLTPYIQGEKQGTALLWDTPDTQHWLSSILLHQGKIVPCLWNWLGNLGNINHITLQQLTKSTHPHRTRGGTHQPNHCAQSPTLGKGVYVLWNFLMLLYLLEIPLKVVCCFVSGKRLFKASIMTQGNNEEHRNDDACSAEGLPKGRWEGGHSEKSTGNAPFLIHPKQKIMTLEPTWETQKCNSENFSGTSCFRLVTYSSGF